MNRGALTFLIPEVSVGLPLWLMVGIMAMSWLALWWRSRRVLTVILLLGWASLASADTITASVTGCGPLPVGATFIGADAHSGFVFMAYHDPLAGCGETTRGATSGTHIAGLNAQGQYQVDVLADLLPTCGRIQYDAQAYASIGGLDPLQLHTYVFDTGVDCVEAQHGGSGSQGGSGTTIGSGPDTYTPVCLTCVVPPIDPKCADCTIDPRSVVPVPEPATLILTGLGLAFLRWRR